MSGRPFIHVHRRARGALVLGGALVLVVALWGMFTGSRQLHEWIVGGCSAICTVIFLAVVYRHELHAFDLRWVDVAQIWRTPWYLITGIGEITWVLCRDLAGHRAPSIFRVCGFSTSKSDPVMVTRRALATAYTSIAPNFIVVGVDYGQSRMLFHQLQRSAVPRMTKNLGAQVGHRDTGRGDETATAEARQTR